MKAICFASFLGLLIIVQIVNGAEKVAEEPIQEPKLKESDATSKTNDDEKSESPTTDENTSEDDGKYALGSLCNYCSYCKVGIYTYTHSGSILYLHQ